MVTESEKRRYLTMLGDAPRGRIIHSEAWSNPDAETYLTGYDYYGQHRQCRIRMRELYPELGLEVPETDAPKPRPKMDLTGITSDRVKHTVRWGDGETGTYEHGEKYFKREEDVFAFDPLEHADMRGWPHVVNNWDFSSEEAVYERFRKDYPAEWEKAPEYSCASVGIYNTMFMWPMLTFGWEMFLACCLDERFEPVMEGFAELNRRAFRAFARLPVNFVICHDDIVMTRGLVCGRKWMRKYIYSRYEEFWAMCKAAGKTVIFVTDGNANDVIDDVAACGAAGLISEPYTDYRAIARRYKDFFMAGEGDNRVLYRGDPAEIKAMFDGMMETSRMTKGYSLSIGNHIPWNVPPQSVKLYLDLCNEYGYRD